MEPTLCEIHISEHPHPPPVREICSIHSSIGLSKSLRVVCPFYLWECPRVKNFISETAWWIFSIRGSTELSRPVIVLLHNSFSLRHEQPEQRILAYESEQTTAVFHKYYCYIKHGGITTNLTLWIPWGYVTHMSRYHNAGIWSMEYNILYFTFKNIWHLWRFVLVPCWFPPAFVGLPYCATSVICPFTPYGHFHGQKTLSLKPLDGLEFHGIV